jgi:murein DD-endopeptidase MepM/ murein hydrolase activator NlpD
MKFWPVPESYSRSLPESGSPGSFWENRDDRHHCGVDIYAPKGSAVRTVEGGEVMEVGQFTSPEILPYWNRTYYILIKHHDGIVSRYAELEKVHVKIGDKVRAGQAIAQVGSVLNPEKITDASPPYIRRLRENGNQSMLHFEIYKGMPTTAEDYLGGNSFQSEKPESLLDATSYLKETIL